MIISFADRDTEDLFFREQARRIDSRIQRTALRKLRYLAVAASLEDLKVPPANRLEALKGDRAGATQHPCERPMEDRVHMAKRPRPWRRNR